MEKPQTEQDFSSVIENDDAIFQSHEDFVKEISMLCHGDLYVIGRIWIQKLRTVLVGAYLSLFPVVKAACAVAKDDSLAARFKKFQDFLFETKPKAPERPPKMKYTDLPIYESPHYEYKEYIEDQKKCPNRNVKILQTYLFPKVERWRKDWGESISEFNKDAGEMKDDACAFICKKKKDFFCYMRCPRNIILRQAVFATGVASGYYLGRGAGVLKRLLFTTLGALSAGALCFPKETDEVFRGGSFKVGDFAVTMFNTICERHLVLRKGVPCQNDMPPEPPPRPADQNNKCVKPPSLLKKLLGRWFPF